MAFANVWVGAEQEELTIDLMRHVRTAPNGMMDYLFSQLMLWGSQRGYRWFNLGMAPLSGLDEHADANRWHRFGDFVFRHADHFYSFQGLRKYKEKFGPVWSPRYLISPGGFALPRILIDVVALNSGGIRGLVGK